MIKGRRWRMAIHVFVALVVIVGAPMTWFMFPPGAMAFAGGDPVELSAYKGASPVGVPPELRSASRIERGKYLTEAADCQACHTATDGVPYAGGRAFDTGFGILYSPNITPDSETGIGSWTSADFRRAVHEGVAKDGSNLYPAFPYESYTALTDDDVESIRTYLSSLAPVRKTHPANRMIFPANQRWLMAFWSFFYNPNKRFQPHSDRTEEWNRGAYMVEAIGHCGDCHTPRNLGQALDNRRKFSGTALEGWSVYNITPDKGSGIGAWTDEQIVTYLKTGHAGGRGAAGGPMVEAVDISLSKVATADLRAMAMYLRTVPEISSKNLPAPRLTAASDAHLDEVGKLNPRGKKMYEGQCVSCHGWSGRSLVSSSATLTGVRSVNDTQATNVVQAVLNGISRPSSTLSMPAFRDSYTDAEIAAVSNYVTARFGATPSTLTVDDVKKLRARSAPPGSSNEATNQGQ